MSTGLQDPAVVRIASSGIDREILATGLLLRAGGPLCRAGTPPEAFRRRMEAAERAERLRTVSLPDLCRQALALPGQDPAGSHADVVRAALSGGAVVDLFSEVFAVQFLAAYNTAEDTTVGWCRETEVRDFKPVIRPEVGIVDELGRLPPGQTAKAVSLLAEGETYQLGRYAAMAAIDEMDLLNDNTDALLTVPTLLGQAARRIRPNLVYAIIHANEALRVDSTALFDAAGHGNYGTASSALAAGSLQTGVAAIGNQAMGGKDAIGLNLKARYLMVPPNLKGTAAAILRAMELASSPAENLILRTDSRMGTAGMIDPATDTRRTGTATNWHLSTAADQGAIEVAYLRGKRQPTVRGYALSNGRFGVGWDVHFDVGAKALDYRGLYFATGAS